MAHRDPSSPTPMPTILRYGIAVLSVAIGIGLDFFLLRHFDAKLTPFLFAVAVTVWYAGTGPGVLAIVLSVLSLNYFFLHSFFSFSPISYADLVYLTFCIFCALAVGWVSAVRRRAEQELRQAREELEAKVVERTANLQRSEAYLAQAQKLTQTGSWVWDPRTEKVLYCSEEMFRIFGLDPRESLPSRDNFRQQIHPEDRDWVKKRFEESLRERVDTFAEYRVLLPDGTVRHINASGHPVLNEDGELIEFIGTATDATERKRAEEALRESEDKLRQLIEAGTNVLWSAGSEGKKAEVQPGFKAQLHAILNVIPAYTWYAAPSGGLTFVNKHTAEYLGLPKDHPLRFGIDIGAQWDAHIPLLHPDDQEESRKAWSTSVRTGEAAEFSFRVRDVQGGYRWFRSRAEPLRASDGTLLLWVGVNLDIEELMCVQEALRESEQSARSAIDGIAGLVSVTGPNGGLETVKRQVLEYFGRSLEWLKNWGTNDAVHPEDLPRVAERFRGAMAVGIPFNFDLRIRRFDGEYRWFELRGVPIRDESGRIVRWYTLLTDIEDRIRTLAQLEQMQSDFAHMNRVSVMGELVASLSHEIAQPIASVRIYARAAQNFVDMQPPDLGEVREALAGIVDNAGRAGDIIDRIRDQIRKAPPRKERFDLNAAINEVIVLGRSAIIKNRVWVQTRLAEGLFPVLGDRVQLQQVVLNLLLNAVEAMGSVEAAPRELLISTKQDHAGVLVAVHDSGPGIHPEQLERVFSSFYTTKPSGTGMGLSICRSIVDAHGGRLWAEANEPRGAIFQFTLPAV
jgi:PAS domain S-box-containing protein